MGELQALEEDILRAKEALEKSEALSRLKTNKDFKKVFIEFYLKEYLISLVHMKALPANQVITTQEYIDAQLMSVSHFNMFIDDVQFSGKQAVQTIQECEHEKLVYLEEEGDNI